MLAGKTRRNAHGFTNIDNYRRRLIDRFGHQMASSHHRTNTRPPTTVHRVEPLHAGETQLEPPRIRHTLVKSEAPVLLAYLHQLGSEVLHRTGDSGWLRREGAFRSTCLYSHRVHVQRRARALTRGVPRPPISSRTKPTDCS
jgi:hypothetical protein